MRFWSVFQNRKWNVAFTYLFTSIAFSLQLKEGEDLISMTESKNLGHFFQSKTRKFNPAWFYSCKIAIRVTKFSPFLQRLLSWIFFFAFWLFRFWDCSVAWWGKNVQCNSRMGFVLFLVMCGKTREPFSRLRWIISGS